MAGAFSFADRRGEHGSAILESFLSMILIGMILFGILQLFQLALADMVADYAAFRGARSAAVGFKEQYIDRQIFVKAAVASGQVIAPDPTTYPDWNRGETEKSLLEDYMNARPRHIEYAYWHGGGDPFHWNYRCPQYGEPMYGDCGICNAESIAGKPKPKIHVDYSGNSLNESIWVKMSFVNYPLTIPLHDWFTGEDSITVSSERVELANHSSAYLE